MNNEKQKPKAKNREGERRKIVKNQSFYFN